MPTAPSKEDHSVALWAALTALFSNIAAVNLLALIGIDKGPTRAIGSLITALCVAGSIYARQRWIDSKAERRKRTRK